MLKLSEDLLDRINVGAGRQEQEARASGSDRGADGRLLMAGEVVEMTMSAASSVGHSCSSSHWVKVAPLIG